VQATARWVPVFLYVVRPVFGPRSPAVLGAFGVHVLAAGVFYGALRRRWGAPSGGALLLLAFPASSPTTTAPMTDAFAADLVMLALAAVVAERPMLAAVAWGLVVLVRPSTVVPAALVLGPARGAAAIDPVDPRRAGVRPDAGWQV